MGGFSRTKSQSQRCIKRGEDTRTYVAFIIEFDVNAARRRWKLVSVQYFSISVRSKVFNIGCISGTETSTLSMGFMVKVPIDMRRFARRRVQ